jgi:hypothetical protein
MRIKTWNLSILPTLILLLSPALSTAEVNISVNIAPPELPVYDQPPIPGDGYVWTPGYWAWGDDIQDYYWVPGTWVPAPEPEYLWTPGYWGANGVAFIWYPGYWGPHVGFYGGVNYGYGYGGQGYEGGYWQGGHMYYNRSVNNISNTTNITNVYNKTVINNVSVTRVSYNGGSGGVRAQPTSTELAAAHEHHIAATPVQTQHIQAARSNPSLRAAANHGAPPIAATARPGAFSGAGVVQATRGGAVHSAPPNAGNASRGTMSVVHANPEPREAQPESRPAPEPRVVRPAPPEAPRQPAPEERRAPQQQEQPHPAPGAAPAPRPQQPPPRAQPRPPEHPPEHPPAREEDREHH